MTITLNGEAHPIAESTTLLQLIEQLELNPRQVAVEVNQQLVPREEHSDRILHDGDSLEVVTLVGGG